MGKRRLRNVSRKQFLNTVSFFFFPPVSFLITGQIVMFFSPKRFICLETFVMFIKVAGISNSVSHNGKGSSL